MNLFIYTRATDLERAAVTSATDLTPVTDLDDLVFGDTEPLAIRLTEDAAGTVPAWCGTAGHSIDVSLGELSSTGSGDYANTASFTFADNVYSGSLNVGTDAMRNWLGGRLAARGTLLLQVRHTGPADAKETLAMLPVQVLGSV